MKKIILLSGGQGAGKSTFARTLSSLPGSVFALADELRRMLDDKYPGVDWFNRSTEYKNTPHPKLENKTPREVMVQLGDMLDKEKSGWLAAKIINRLYQNPLGGIFVVDDLRRVSELDTFRTVCGAYGWRVIHFHIDGGKPDFDHDKLREQANYIISRGQAEPTQVQYAGVPQLTFKEAVA